MGDQDLNATSDFDDGERETQPVSGDASPTQNQDHADLPTLDGSPTSQASLESGTVQFDAEASKRTFGRYTLKQPLGKGGMGTVYLAHDSKLDRLVALKVPHLGEGDGSLVLERFYREARAAANLNHVNLCPVYDVGEINGEHFLTMPYVKGRPLTEYIANKKKLSIKQILLLVRKLALAMQVAHEQDVIHRDLKPANILISDRNQPVIVDFGLARRVQNESQLTQTGTSVGSPYYMSPEQVKGEQANLGPACDIYSLGVILYELLTGHPPFRGDLFAVISQIVATPANAPSSERKDIASDVDAICLKALEKEPSQRFEHMKAFATAIERLLRDESKVEASPEAEMEIAPLANPDGFDPFGQLSPPLAAPPGAPKSASPQSGTQTGMASNVNTSAVPTGHASHPQAPQLANPYRRSPPATSASPNDVQVFLNQAGRAEFYRLPLTRSWMVLLSTGLVGGFRLMVFSQLMLFALTGKPGILGWICAGFSMLVTVVCWTNSAMGIHIIINKNWFGLKPLLLGNVGLIALIVIETILVFCVFVMAPYDAIAPDALYEAMPSYEGQFEKLEGIDPEQAQQLEEISDPFKAERYRSAVVRLFVWLMARGVEVFILGMGTYLGFRLLKEVAPKLEQAASPKKPAVDTVR